VLWKASGSLAIFLALAGHVAFRDFPVTFQPDEFADLETARFIFPLLFGCLLFLSLLCARLEGGLWHPTYPVLFRSAWSSLCTLAEALLFTELFWLLLFLWAVLFDILGNPLFQNLFGDARFAYPATTVAFAVATQVIGSSERLIAGVLE